MYTSSCVRRRRVRVGGGRLNSLRERHWIRVTVLAAAAATTTATSTATSTFTTTVTSRYVLFLDFQGTQNTRMRIRPDAVTSAQRPHVLLPVERASLIGGSVVPVRWVEAVGPPAGCGGGQWALGPGHTHNGRGWSGAENPRPRYKVVNRPCAGSGLQSHGVGYLVQLK